MGLFSRYKTEYSSTKESTEAIWAKITQIATELIELKSQVAFLEQHLKSLRGFVNKKVGNDEIEETEKHKNNDGFDFLRL